MLTKKEIAKCLMYSEIYINRLFEKATPTHKGLQEKKGHYSKMKAINYTLDECLYAMSFNPFWNPMMEQYLRENFIHRDGTCFDRTQIKKTLNRDARQFLWIYKHLKETRNTLIKVCNTCAYCIPKLLNITGVTQERPFYNFYNTYLFKHKINVYKDRCESFCPSEKEPRIWEKGFPTNINLYGDADKKILGIDPSVFISERPRDEDIYLVSEVKTVGFATY